MPFTINGTTGINLGTEPLTGSLPDANAPSGSVIQVVQFVKTDVFSSTTINTFLNCGLEASITPTSSSSRILVLAHLSVGHNISTNNMAYRLVKNGSAIYVGDASGSEARVSSAGFLGANDVVNNGSAIFVDSPATTSSTTYGVQLYAGAGGSGTIYLNRAVNSGSVFHTRGASSITLMEIAA
jgi:hypothetical protein